MTTMEDLAVRLFNAHQRTFVRLARAAWDDVIHTRWEDIPPDGQECWLSVAFEAAKAGAEVQKEIAAKEAAESHAMAKAFVNEAAQRIARRSYWNEFSAERRCEGRVNCYASSQRTGRCLLVIGHEGECQ